MITAKSKKNWPLAELIKEITNYGTPLIIACDTTNSSHLAENLKATFGARLFTPTQSMHIFQKQRVAKKSYENFRNSHERDAIAAAKKAFNHVANKLRQTTARPGCSNPEVACRAVLNGSKMSDVA